MDPGYLTMKGTAPIQPQMTPPPEDCGFIGSDHIMHGNAMPTGVAPHGELPTPDSLSMPPPLRRRSVTASTITTTTTITSATTACSSVDTDGQTPTKKHSRGGSTNPRYSRRSSAVSDIIFSPRPVEHMCAEQAYLSSTLHNHSLRAADLIRHYTSVDLQLQSYRDSSGAGNPGCKIRRRLRKQLSKLKGKIQEVGHQERAAAARLGEVGVELHSHDMWQRERVRYSPLWLDTSSPAISRGEESYFVLAPTPLSYGFNSGTPLSALSPMFVPGGFDPWSWSEAKGIDAVLDTVVEDREDFYGNHGLEFVYCCDTEDAVDDTTSISWRLSSDGSESTTKRERRPSLPNMSTVWPEEGQQDMEN